MKILQRRSSMRLVSFTVENFRSIKKAYKIHVGTEKTVLVGPNNEGKSNLLKAFSVGLNLLLAERDEYSFRLRGDGYNWQKDFPLDLQEKDPKGESDIEFEFELDQKEKTTFKKITGSDWDSTLKVLISFSPSRPKIEIKTKGRAKKSVNEKQEKILEFLRKHIAFHSVPAIRTADLTRRLASRLIFQDLESQKKSAEYLELQKKIEDIESVAFKSLSDKTKAYLSDFVADCESVTFKRIKDRYVSSESLDLIINDGVSTSIEAKGDGIQSLIAIAMIVLTSEVKAQGKSQFCTIEEPESHLHPKAVHEVSRALNKISANIQTIISTHSPLIIDRENIKNNIIVDGGRAYSAENISQLRDILGIQRTDNLESTRAILLCEGPSDRLILTTWLRTLSPRLSEALTKGILDIVPIHGIGKLEYQINLYKSLLCAIHLFSDYDKASKERVEIALKNKRLEHSEYNYSILKGHKESELEDFIQVECYQSILSSYGIDLGNGEFKNKTKKWTDKIRILFKNIGKDFPYSLEEEIKTKVSEAVQSSPHNSMKEDAREIMDSLVLSLELKTGISAKKNS